MFDTILDLAHFSLKIYIDVLFDFSGTPKEKPSTLPLSDGHKKFFQALASSTQSSVTPQMALLHTMAAMHQKVTASLKK